MTTTWAKILIAGAVALAIIASLGGDWLVVIVMVMVILGQLAVLRGSRRRR